MGGKGRCISVPSSSLGTLYWGVGGGALYVCAITLPGDTVLGEKEGELYVCVTSVFGDTVLGGRLKGGGELCVCATSLPEDAVLWGRGGVEGTHDYSTLFGNIVLEAEEETLFFGRSVRLRHLLLSGRWIGGEGGDGWAVRLSHLPP